MKNDFLKKLSSTQTIPELVRIFNSIDEYKFPPELKHLTSLVKWLNTSNLKTHKIASQVTAITIASALASGKIWTQTNAPTSLYLVLILPTGAGKNSLLEIPPKLIRYNIENNNLTSLGALEDMLVENPNVTHVIDEYGDILADMLSDKNGSLKSILAAQKSIYSCANGEYVTRRFSTQGGQKDLKQRIIKNPCYSIAGLTTEMQLFNKLNISMLFDGSLNRFIFINGTGLESNFNDLCNSNPPHEITNHIKLISDNDNIPQKVIMTYEAKNYYDNIIGDADLRGTDIHIWVNLQEHKREISVRWRENSIRLATALAAYERWDTLPLWLLEWSYGFVKFNSISFMETFENRKNTTEFTEILDAVIKWFKHHKKSWNTLAYIAKNGTRLSGMASKERKIILNELVERGDLIMMKDGRTTLYRYK